MKRNFIGSLSLAVLSLMLTAGAHAQSAYSAYVPFAFQAGAVQMPAGHYQVREDHLTHMIRILNVGTGAIVNAPVQQDSARGLSAKIVFHRFGQEYFLASITGTPDTMDVTLSTSRQEKELRMRLVAQNPSNHGEQVLIALK